MKSLKIAVLILVLAALPALAGLTTFNAAVSVTSTNSVVTLSPATPAFVRILNDGPGAMWVDFDRVAVANADTAVKVMPCEGIEVATDNASISTLGLISSSGVTTSARVTASYELTKDGRGPNSPLVDKYRYIENKGCESAAFVGMTTANGASFVPYVDSEVITLDTGGATTDSSSNLLHANSIIGSVVCRQTTSITVATNWGISDPTTANRFAPATAIGTATLVGLDHWSGAVSTLAAGPSQAAAAKLRITTTGSNPGAGVVRCTVFGWTATAPTN